MTDLTLEDTPPARRAWGALGPGTRALIVLAWLLLIADALLRAA